MEKQLPRPDTPRALESELVLDVKYNQVEKTAIQVDFEKASERKNDIEKVDQELVIEKNYTQVEKNYGAPIIKKPFKDELSDLANELTNTTLNPLDHSA